MLSDLARRYGQDKLPRYTSYPTTPHFSPRITHTSYLIEQAQAAVDASKATLDFADADFFAMCLPPFPAFFLVLLGR